MSCCIFILIVALFTLHTSAMNILIFGGNGFIGSHVSEHLLDAGHKLTLVSSSGSFAWNTADTVQRRIDRHIRCDRYNPNKCDEALWREFENASEKYQAIIDFSAYRLDAVKPFYEKIVSSIGRSQKVPLYIYISTDSVYEVCIKQEEDRLLKETDSVRPEDELERKKLAKGDSYGHLKLEIEEFLIDQRKNANGLPYVILRLPDVLGERDSTERWWKYQLWLRYGKFVNRPVLTPTFADSLATSYVDVKDIASIIQVILSRGFSNFDQIYNVGFEQPITLRDLLSAMQIHSDAPTDSILTVDNGHDEVPSYFPSVTRGGLDVSKALKELNWKPAVRWQDTIQRISKFYIQAERNYKEEALKIAKKLARDLNLDDNERNQFLEVIQKTSPLDASEMKKRRIDEF